MPIISDLKKAVNHGTNYFFGHRPGTTRGKNLSTAMPPSGSDRPPATSPTPNESIALKPAEGIQDNQYGILGPNAPTGPGPQAGTDFATPQQNVAFREGIEPISNPPGISVVSTTDWFGPLQPLRPSAPMGTQPRKFEYVLGQNIIFEPRANEAISYRTLRSMGDAMDLMRIVIETVKNEMKRSAWEITAPAKYGETGGQRKERELQDPVVREIKELLARPDGLHPWETFIGEVMEDMLVTDAPSILVRRSPDGKKVIQLIAVDGSKITRYITTSGLTPTPDPRCSHPGHALLGHAQTKQIQVCPCAAYTQYLYGVNAVNLTTRDLVYMPYNMRPHKLYGYSPVEQVIVAVNLYLRREMSLLSYYTEGNIPEMIGFLPNSVTISQVKEFEEWFNTVNRGDSAFMRRVRFVPNPSPMGDPKFVELKDKLLADGIDEWLIRLICYAFNVPPTQLVKLHARSASDTMKEEAQMTGLESYQRWFAGVMNHIIQDQMGYKGYAFSFLPVRDPDILKQAQADQLKTKSGRMTLNEWRESEGAQPYDPVKFPDADKPIIFTPQGYVIVSDGAGQLVAAPKPEGAERPNTHANPNNQGSRAHEAEESPPAQKLDFPIHAAAGSAPSAAQERMRESLMRIFRMQRSSLRKSLSELSKAKNDEKRLKRQVWLAIAAYYSLLPEAVEPAIRMAAVDAAVQAATQAGVSPGWAIESFEPAADYARARAAEMVGMRRLDDGTLVENPDARWVISDTTRDEIRKAVDDALSGASKEPVADAIERALVGSRTGPFSEYRSNLIAKTEIANARSAAKYEAWKRIGVLATTWFTMGDEKVCPECASNEGITVPLGKKFPSGAERVPEHPQCRCFQVPRGTSVDKNPSTLVNKAQVISATIGIKGGKTEVQSLIFHPKKDWNKDLVGRWLKEHGYKQDIEETGSSYRARQHDPKEFDEIRTKVFTENDAKSREEHGKKPLKKSSLSVPDDWTAYFLRHGETEANEKDEARGWGRWPLTPEGRLQAQSAAEFLLGHQIDRIIASDLPRARQTAQIVASVIRVPVHYARNIRSLNVGIFTGKSKAKTRDRFMHFLLNPKVRIPGGETLSGFIKRVVKFAIKMLAADDGETILFITHSSDIGALWYAFNHGKLTQLADTEVVLPGGVAKLRDGEIHAIFRPAPPRKGDLE